MRKVHILVEGQTEETFVRELLAPYLLPKDIVAQATLAATKRVKRGPLFKGGVVSYGKVKNDLLRLLRDTSATRVTTLLDFYGLPKDFPGLASMPDASCYDKAAHLERAFMKDINRDNFLPYFSLHEFEGLMFASPKAIADVFPGTSPQHLVKLENIRSSFNSPEEINDGPTTAPSKRIKEIFSDYQKTFHGPLVAINIGIDSIRQECEHFNQWLTKLESL